MSAPLDGVIVVALEAAVAAPFATRQLADLGARVLKVERPGEGDFARHYDSAVDGTSAFFVWANRGKQSIELDLKDSDDRAALDRLVAGADVFVQNLSPAAARRAGLLADQLREGLPGLLIALRHLRLRPGRSPHRRQGLRPGRSGRGRGGGP